MAAEFCGMIQIWNNNIFREQLREGKWGLYLCCGILSEPDMDEFSLDTKLLVFNTVKQQYFCFFWIIRVFQVKF